MTINLYMLAAMKHSPIKNYIVPGLTSWLIGEPSPKGATRLFECSRDHQESITPHSHRFDFQCWVLAGKVTNRVWTYSDYGGDLYTQTNLVYGGEPGQYERVRRGIDRYTYTDEVHKADDWYSMTADQIHSVYFAKGTQVLFFEGPTKMDHSLILEPHVDGKDIPVFKVEPWMFIK